MVVKINECLADQIQDTKNEEILDTSPYFDRLYLVSCKLYLDCLAPPQPSAVYNHLPLMKRHINTMCVRPADALDGLQFFLGGCFDPRKASKSSKECLGFGFPNALDFGEG